MAMGIWVDIRMDFGEGERKKVVEFMMEMPSQETADFLIDCLETMGEAYKTQGTALITECTWENYIKMINVAFTGGRLITQNKKRIKFDAGAGLFYDGKKLILPNPFLSQK